MLSRENGELTLSNLQANATKKKASWNTTVTTSVMRRRLSSLAIGEPMLSESAAAPTTTDVTICCCLHDPLAGSYQIDGLTRPHSSSGGLSKMLWRGDVFENLEVLLSAGEVCKGGATDREHAAGGKGGKLKLQATGRRKAGQKKVPPSLSLPFGKMSNTSKSP